MTTPEATLLPRIGSAAMALGIDAGALAGACLIAYGVHMIHPPSAYIAGGFMLMLLSVTAARRAG